jgi:putative transposase
MLARMLPSAPNHLPSRQPLSQASQTSSPWPHAPTHRLSNSGTYFVTASTYQKLHHFRTPDRLDFLQQSLLTTAAIFGWQLEAWAVFSNHYHFIAHSPSDSTTAENLPAFLKHLHSQTATAINDVDSSPARSVWFNYWETRLTIQPSYLARLNYVHQNAVKHRLVPCANQYPWCSAAWFERTASNAIVTSIYRFKTDRLNINDPFEPILDNPPKHSLQTQHRPTATG